jgi:hypothetical protein
MNIKKGIAVLLIATVVILLGLAFYASLPKELATPQKWSEEATAKGVVSKVKPNGIEVRFTEGKIKGKVGFFPGERAFTNGQNVCVKCTVYYARYYDTGFGAVQWVHRSVLPLNE